MNNPKIKVPRFEAISPRLPAIDVDEALKYYCDQLGFQLGWKWGDPVTHANVCRDSISLDLIASPPKIGPALAYIQLTGVDDYYSELKQRNVEVGDLGNRPYGMRDFELVDPSGNRLAFGEPTVD